MTMFKSYPPLGLIGSHFKSFHILVQFFFYRKRQCTYNVVLRRFRVTIVAVEKQ